MTYCSTKLGQCQKGAMLMEAVVAMSLLGLVALGPAYSLAKSSTINRQTSTQLQSAVQLKSLISSQGTTLCSSSNAPQIQIGQESYDVTVNCRSAELTSNVPGASAVALPLLSLSVDNTSLYGQGKSYVVGR